MSPAAENKPIDKILETKTDSKNSGKHTPPKTGVEKPKSCGKRKCFYSFIIVLCFAGALGYIANEVKIISKKVSAIKISDNKIDYVHSKVGELVRILDMRESSSVEYPADQAYEFKGEPSGNELVADETLATTTNDATLQEELNKMDDSQKLKIVRDKLVDIYQKYKVRDDETDAVKQSFYDTRKLVEDWLAEKHGVKPGAPKAESKGLMGKLKNNLGNFVQINKLDEDLTKSGKKVITIEQIPEMLDYAEDLIETGSFSQVVWIMEDIQALTKQEQIFAFTAKAEVFLEKYPNPNSDLQEIKKLIDMIENQY